MAKVIAFAKTHRPSGVERDMVVGMVVSGRFLRRLRPHWDPAWHSSEMCRLVAGWCAEHWDKYREAPGREIERRWTDWAERPQTSEDDRDDAARMLELASDAHGRRDELFNDDYLIDRTERWARGQVLRAHSTDLEGALDAGDVDDAADAATDLALPRIGGQRSWTDPHDPAAIKRALERAYDPLFRIPGALGELLGPQMYRGAFVAWMAPEKRGKTALLVELAYWAARGRCNVAYFTVGDMDEEQMTVRWASRLLGKPDHAITPGQARKAVRRFDERYAAQGRLRLQFWPSFAASHEDLERELDAWEMEGWVADVVIVDYADNLEPPPARGRDDHRHRVNSVWQGQRRISQVRHCLVLTVTQTDAKSYEKKRIGLGNFSEDKRKYAHVTAMGTIDQDAAGGDEVQTRWLLLRRGHAPSRVVAVGTDLARGRFLAGTRASRWLRKGEGDENPSDDE